MNSNQNQSVVYNPNGLLDAALSQHRLRNDAALARMLGVAPPVVSKIRHQKLPVGASMILKFHELLGMSVSQIRSYIGGQA